MFNLAQTLRDRLNQSMVNWMDSHSPVGKEHILHLKNLYIFPSKLGWAFLLLIGIIWLLGTNYQNNIILALAYFQLSLFTVCILHTYHNLAGLRLRILSAENVFAGDVGKVVFAIKHLSGRKSHHVKLYFAENLLSTFDFVEASEQVEDLWHPPAARGQRTVERLRIESHFPMGLFKCGSWLRFDANFLVYPRPVSCPRPNPTQEIGDQHGPMRLTSDPQEFFGFKAYVPGDSKTSIAWKRWARNQELMTYAYAQPQSDTTQLRWSDFYAGNKEQALAHFCYWILLLHQQNRSFAIEFAGQTLNVDDGSTNIVPALAMLAQA